MCIKRRDADQPQQHQLLSQISELIFVDGTSTDQTVTIAQKYGKVIQTRKNRAVQMNAGASIARGDILLFLHAIRSWIHKL
ncbi:MAG: glycosyltransferase [Chlamydiae bacterium]|nr:glycosyltransferase [Chlamydiota bacterium]MBI3276830.1 glycosyltransferase [Chlamydiota bacterium]